MVILFILFDHLRQSFFGNSLASFGIGAKVTRGRETFSVDRSSLSFTTVLFAVSTSFSWNVTSEISVKCSKVFGDTFVQNNTCLPFVLCPCMDVKGSPNFVCN